MAETWKKGERRGGGGEKGRWRKEKEKREERKRRYTGKGRRGNKQEIQGETLNGRS